MAVNSAALFLKLGRFIHSSFP